MPIVSDKVDQLAVNTIRFLSVDAVQKANQDTPECQWVQHHWHMYCMQSI
jgi:hypothetical protein